MIVIRLRLDTIRCHGVQVTKRVNRPRNECYAFYAFYCFICDHHSVAGYSSGYNVDLVVAGMEPTTLRVGDWCKLRLSVCEKDEIGRYAQKVGKMTLVLMFCVFIVSGLGTQIEMRHPIQNYCMIVLATISGLYIVFDLCATWTVWSKAAKKDGAIK